MASPTCSFSQHLITPSSRPLAFLLSPSTYLATLMDELGCLLNYQENIDELKQKLFYTTMERDSLKAQASEQMRKHKQHEEQLLKLLKDAYHERDEVKKHLQMLLAKLPPAESSDLQHPLLLQPQQTKAISSITESNSFSNHHSHGSSPILEGVSSPEFSGVNMADSRHPVAVVDPTDVVMENLARGLVLPQKGKLLSAVIEAGPPLHSLLVAGPLPMWKNPPPMQHFKVLPLSCPRTAAIGISGAQKAKNLQSQVGSLRNCSASLLDFRNGFGSDVRSISMYSSSINPPAIKRQCIQ